MTRDPAQLSAAFKATVRWLHQGEETLAQLATRATMSMQNQIVQWKTSCWNKAADVFGGLVRLRSQGRISKSRGEDRTTRAGE